MQNFELSAAILAIFRIKRVRLLRIIRAKPAPWWKRHRSDRQLACEAAPNPHSFLICAQKGKNGTRAELGWRALRPGKRFAYGAISSVGERHVSHALAIVTDRNVVVPERAASCPKYEII